MNQKNSNNTIKELKKQIKLLEDTTKIQNALLKEANTWIPSYKLSCEIDDAIKEFEKNSIILKQG